MVKIIKHLRREKKLILNSYIITRENNSDFRQRFLTHLSISILDFAY